MIRVLILCLSLLCGIANANPIDDHCGQLTYKLAPETTKADAYRCYHEYAVAFNFATKQPVYTTEFLVASHTGKLPRTNDFRVDPSIPVQYQISPKEYVDNTACSGGERCDKGHMTPDQDFSACEVCVHESFYMTNMVPQSADNNEHIWKAMEMKFRKMAAVTPIYVITGPIFSSEARVTTGFLVPDKLFKIAVEAATGECTTYLMPNTKLPVEDLEKYRSTLSAVSAATGIKFNSSMKDK